MKQKNSRLKLKFELWKLLLITVMVLFPFPVFIVIVYSEPVVKYFFQIPGNSPELAGEVPNYISEFWFYFTIWFSIAFILFAILILLIYTYNFHGRQKKYYSYDISIMFSILLIIIFSIILLTLSEIRYYFLISYCDSIHKFYTPGGTGLSAKYKDFDAIFTKIKAVATNTMHWVDYKNSLWFSGVEIGIICILFLNFQLKAFSNSLDATTSSRLKKLYSQEIFGETKEKQFLSKFLNPDPKNISIFLIIFSFIVLFPSVYYLVKISFFDNSFSEIIKYTFIEPTLPKLNVPYANPGGYYDFMREVLGPYHYNYSLIEIIFYLPEIFLILSGSFTIVFIFFVFNDRISSLNFLMTLTIILWFLSIITSVFVFYSTYFMDHVSSIWENGLKSGKYEDWVKTTFNLGIWSGSEIINPWLSNSESVSLLILEFSLFSSVSIIGVSQIFKNQKAKKTSSLIRI